MVASVSHAVVTCPFFGRLGIVSHKKKKRPQFSPRPPRSSLLLEEFKVSHNALKRARTNRTRLLELESLTVPVTAHSQACDRHTDARHCRQDANELIQTEASTGYAPKSKRFIKVCVSTLSFTLCIFSVLYIIFILRFSV